MPWHALSSLDDALTASKKLLLPFSLRRWLTLAIVAFFVSGATAFEPNASFSFGDGANGAAPGDPISIVSDGLSVGQLQLLIALVAVALVVGVVLTFVAAVMEFVFVDIAREQEVRVRDRFGQHTDAGASLFLFRIAVGLLVLATALTALGLVFVTGGLFVLVLLLLSPALVLIGIALWLVLRLTTDFVVPIMLAEGIGVLDGWRTFWPELRAEWRQYGAYALARIVLGGVGATVAGIGFVTVAVVLVIPFGAVGLGGAILFAQVLGLNVVGFAIGAIAATLFALSVLVVGTTLVQVPIQTYLRYYSLFVLGGVTPEYDLVAPIREEIDAGDADARVGADDTPDTDEPPRGDDTDDELDDR